MNKAELIDAIAKKTLLKKNDARKFLNAFLDVTSESLEKGGPVTLIGFGTFSVVERSARVGRNPSTGTALKVPAKKVVKFKPSTALKDKVK
jgi:DNA-binding protein HU-beta